MNQDETPIHKIIWQRFAKRCGELPVLGAPEAKVTDAITRNWLALLRGSLITGAIFLVLHSGTPTLQQIWRSTGAKLPGIANHRASYLGGVLFILSLLAPWLCSVAIRVWRYFVRTQFTPVAGFLGLLLILAVERQCPSLHALSLIGWVMIFVAVTRRFWIQKESQEGFKDRLQRAYFVNRLFDHFQAHDTALRRIAILGGWGMGKTVVLDLLRTKLRQSINPRFGIAMINPWVAQSPEEVHAMIAQGFEEALGYRDYFRPDWTRFGWLSWISKIKPGNGPELTLALKELFHGSSAAQEERLVARINHTLRAVKRVCVILVDDMERAEPQVIRKVFPVIDILRRIKPCFFVFGIDPVRIASAFDEKRRSSDQTKGYLDKVFDLQIELPHARSKDVALMCKDLIDQEATPKLNACWDELAPLVSGNPRDAKHFVSDVASKEVLFLSRFGPEEHDYTGFFKLRMLELEVPGIAEHIQRIVEIYRGEKYNGFMVSAVSGETPQIDAAFNAAWEAVKNEVDFPAQKEGRVKKLFKEVLDSRVDLPWACSHYMRLLILNAKEWASLRKIWMNQAGRISITEMIKLAAPQHNFADNERIATQLIESELEEYSSLRDKLIGARNPTKATDLLDDAKRKIQDLIMHIEYSLANRFDRSIFPTDYFESWIKILFRGNIKKEVIDTTKLSELEVDHSIHASDLLSLKDAYHFARWPTANILYHRSMGDNVSDHLASHIDTLKNHMQKRIYGELKKHIRSGSVDSHAFVGMLGIQTLAQVFGDLEAWNPNADDFRGLHELEQEAATNQQISSSMAKIIDSLLFVLGTNARNEACYGPNIAELINKHPEYTAMMWRMGLRCADQEDDLKLRRTHTRKAIGPNSPITVAQFDLAFPMDAVCESAMATPRDQSPHGRT